MFISLPLGANRVGLSGNETMVIMTSGEAEDLYLEYYIPKGLSVNEGEFTWTAGNTLEAHIPCDGKGRSFEVSIDVAGTFDGAQRYQISSGEGEEILSGSLEGEGKIVFPVTAADGGIMFRMNMPDAAVVSQRYEASEDNRMVAFQIRKIEIREAGQ